MKPRRRFFLTAAILMLAACSFQTAQDCLTYAGGGFRKIADERSRRFLGKVQEDTVRCRGGEKAVGVRHTPWTDWQNYWAAGDSTSKARGPSGEGIHLSPNGRGIDGALLDLEYQRIELIKFNLLDNSGTYDDYIRGRDSIDGAALKIWDEMRLPKDHPSYLEVGGEGAQLCRGELIRFRTLSGICNDIRNPLMGSSSQPFARNVEFDTTFPDLGQNEVVKNRHGNRLGLLNPDPQVISRKLLTRAQSDPSKCQDGQGLPNYSAAANCDYQSAPFFNTLAAFWIQFMTHDWFSHLEEGHNGSELIDMGCAAQLVRNNRLPLTPQQIDQLKCRPGDRIDKSRIAREDRPPTFMHEGKEHLSRAHKTTENKVTAWWDASQLYGFNETSRRRVKRDPADPATFLLVNARSDESMGYLPLLQPSDPMNPQWAGQEASAFPDNWSIGLSFYHNVFAREHNLFIDAFRKQAAATPDDDSGLRSPAKPDHVNL